jgi:hypothetical protein
VAARHRICIPPGAAWMTSPVPGSRSRFCRMTVPPVTGGELAVRAGDAGAGDLDLGGLELVRDGGAPGVASGPRGGTGHAWAYPAQQALP